MNKNYPTITIGELKKHLEAYPDDYELDFCGLSFYRLKQRGDKSVQLEFNQQVYRTPEGVLVVEDLG